MPSGGASFLEVPSDQHFPNSVQNLYLYAHWLLQILADHSCYFNLVTAIIGGPHVLQNSIASVPQTSTLAVTTCTLSPFLYSIQSCRRTGLKRVCHSVSNHVNPI
jgi:hypothetical protein